MKNVFRVLCLFVLITSVVSCGDKDDAEMAAHEQRHSLMYAEQYAADLAAIQTFLKTHSITVTNAPGLSTDQDVTYTTLPTELDPTSIWGSNPTTHNANLLEWPVERDGITYIIYYLKLREGSGPTSKSPCNLDGVLTAYKGQLMDDTMKVFDNNPFPQSFFNLSGLILGWSEIFPKFKTGSYVSNTDGSVTYNDFGAGVMFIPSGLAYYNTSSSDIPAYSPIMFSFKLFEVQRSDNDADGIFSYQEDINGDGYIRDNEITDEDDTDHDKIPDAIDVDDDGDNFLTKVELKKPDDTYHTFETVPSCTGQTAKRYLTSGCIPPYSN